MAYITSTYYNDTYKGTSIADDAELDRLIKRASDLVDLITGYKVKKSENGLDDFHQFVQDQVKLSVASVTEHFIMNGGYEAVMGSDDFNNVSVGGFSYTLNASNGKKVDVPERAIMMISSTGLLYAGIDTEDGTVGY